MNFGTIKTHDVANGPGVRVSLFVSGCTHHCKDCFNEETWDFNYGQSFTQTEADKVISALSPSYIKGFSLLGGEPFEPANQKVLLPLLEKIKATYPDKTIWCYSGYLLDKDLMPAYFGNAPKSDTPCSRAFSKAVDYSVTAKMLACIDVLVDGEFVAEKKDIRLIFKGSKNQRIIDVKQSLEQKKIVRCAEDVQNEQTGN